MSLSRSTLLLLVSFGFTWQVSAWQVAAQQPPEIGYMMPPGGAAGTTIEVILGGYDWTPDMEVFVHESRIGLELQSAPGPILVPEPPYWFEKKARRSPDPLPRETIARLILPAELAPGIYRWQAANANGATATGRFFVSSGKELIEQRHETQAQDLGELPVTVSGQIVKIEEVDRYRFIPSESGPITLTTMAMALGSPLNAVLEVRDQSGRMLAEAADTDGHDLQLTFFAEAGAVYVASLYDLDFRGDRSFVYRLSITPGARVLTTIPAAGPRGETRPVELVGIGIATGAARLESLTSAVTFPTSTDETWTWRAESPFLRGTPIEFRLSDLPERVEPRELDRVARTLTVPSAVTGVLEQRFEADRYWVAGKQGEQWALALEAQTIGSRLDVSLSIHDAQGKELQRVDDLPGTTDAGLEFSVPADGDYQLTVSDVSGHSGNRAATYRLVVQQARPGFTLSGPEFLNLPLSGTSQLTLKAHRSGGFNEAITIHLAGLPTGVTTADELVIPAGKNELKVNLSATADSGSGAALLTISGQAKVGEQELMQRISPVLLARTMKPPFSVDAEGQDDVTKWPRGTTFPAPVLIQREAGFQGDIVLEMSAKQGRHRQGIRGPELTVPPGVDRVLYPVFLPEWLETTRTSRMVVNGVAQVPDPQGRVRYLSTKLKTRIGFLPGGALLKVASDLREFDVVVGQPFIVPLNLSRARDLVEPASVELIVDEELARHLDASSVMLERDSTQTALTIVTQPEAALLGERELTIRATVLRDGSLPVVSETQILVAFHAAETTP